MEAGRYPLSVRVLGVMRKGKSKMFVVSVLWSDQSDIMVYRTFADFQNMHKQLKKSFPSAHKLKKDDRGMPKFPDKKMKLSRQKGAGKSLERIKLLQKYCTELMNCDQRVCSTADLIQFFHPKDQDLQPEFSKNSIMIMPTNDELSAEAGQGDIGHVTQPFVTETYRCVAAYETKDTKNKPFKVAMDEKVDVLIKDKAGWWLVEKEGKQMAWFPAPYLEKLDDDEFDEDDVDGSPERGMLFTAVKGYTAAKNDEISVPVGAVAELLQTSESGWWLMRYNGKTGYIPAMYLTPNSNPCVRLTASYPDGCLPSPRLARQADQFRGSQGNLLQLQPNSREKSRSLNMLSELCPSPMMPKPISHAAKAPAAPAFSKHNPPPTIIVEMDGDDGRSPTEGSLGSDSSFSDDVNSSLEGSRSNLSMSLNEQQMRYSCPPQPPSMMRSNSLNPSSEGGMKPSVSDSNLFKAPLTPKMPPRPRANELIRCTTVTRKNAAQTLTPGQTQQ